MSASKKNIAFTLVFACLLASFLVFVTAIKGDNALRIFLATGGFVVFAGLFLALLIASKRMPSS